MLVDRAAFWIYPLYNDITLWYVFGALGKFILGLNGGWEYVTWKGVYENSSAEPGLRHTRE